MGVGVIIVAAGSGRRMGAAENKVLLPLGGKLVLEHSVDFFTNLQQIDEVVVVTREVDLAFVEKLLNASRAKKQIKVVAGGQERQDSVYNGLQVLSSDLDWVLIHDGARPYLTEKFVQAGLQTVKTKLAVGTAVPVKDTIKRVKGDLILETPPRDELWAMQTPQIFSASLIRQAHDYAKSHQIIATDDCALVEKLGYPVHIVEGDYGNIKITTPEDLPMESQFLVGYGYDVHRLVENRPLILGGLKIPHKLGLLGHSDADVVTHAIMDALLGAAGLGDIGELFPDTDPKYEGISSVLLLQKILTILRERQLKINNLDITIMAQQPKLAPFKRAMRANLAKIMEIDETRINIKATTTEGLGFVGREEGIATQVVVSLHHL